MPEACVAACYGCHRWLDAHPKDREALGRRKLGDDRYEELERYSKMTLKDFKMYQNLKAQTSPKLAATRRMK